MKASAAVTALSALAHPQRLSLFRALVRQGPDGMTAGALADVIKASPAAASFHLKELDRAGLIFSTRAGRFVRYAIHVEGMRALLTYLTKDCCQGQPELCGDMLKIKNRRAYVRVRPMPADRPMNVLFLCTHNSARSIIAEAAMNRLGMGRFKGFSAGSQPSGRVHPYALDLLAQLNYDTSALRSKTWDAFAEPDAPKMDFVFTVCDNAANETCPYWPGQPMTAHWGLPDPSAATGTEAERRLAFADTHRMLYQRISIFVNLPLASLDKMALQKQLDDIGRATIDAAHEKV